MSSQSPARPWLLGLALLCACTPGGCPGGVPDGGPADGGPPDASIDAATEAGFDGGADSASDSGSDTTVDSSTDAGLDGSFDAAPDAATDASPDATIDAATDAATDAAADARSCDICVASRECMTATCVGAACVESPVANGMECGELVGGLATQICVAGSCVLRHCGDGYREPGPMPVREACDDGNDSDTDACSRACLPQILDLDVPPDGSFEASLAAGAASVAQSGSGDLLFVWLRDHYDHAEVVTRRYSASGVARPLATDPLVLDGAASAFDAAPSVAALPGAAGWVVVWVARRFDHARVMYRFVARSGALGIERAADDEPTNQAAEARVTALSDGFVIAWTATLAASRDPAGGVRARVFDASGTPTSPSFLPAADVSRREEAAALASVGDDWLLLYGASSLRPGSTAELFARRFSGTVALDSDAIVLDASGGYTPAAAALGMGASGARYALEFVQAGQVFAGTLEPSPLDLGSSLHVLMPAGADDRDAPCVARYGAGTLVAFEHGFPSRLNVLSETATLPPELSILLADWSGSAEGPVDARRMPSGTWLVWAGSEGPTRTRAVRAFRMP